MACNNSATLMVESKSKAGQQQQRRPQHPNQLAKATDKSNSNSNSGKSLVDRDNLKDEDFDKLVRDISNLIQDKDHKDRKLLASNPSPRDGNSIDEAAACREGSSSSNRSQDDSNNYQDAHSAFQSDQPKRPMNAFMVWGRAIRREIHLRFSNVQNALLSKALGRVWRSLDQADKEPYVRKANLIKAKHRRDYPNYRYQPRRLQEVVMDRGQREAAANNNNRPAINCSQINYAPGKKNCRPIWREQPALDNVNSTHQQQQQQRIKHADVSSHVRPDGLMFAANQSHAVTTLTYQDNNHIVDNCYTGYCAGASAACSGGSGATVGPSGVAYLKTQYNDGYHTNHQQQQQHRSAAATREQPSDCSYHLNCHPQFAYNMQPQQQHQQTYQQPTYIEASQVTSSTNYGDSCSFSAGRNSDQTRFMLPITSIATNSGQTKAHESRNNRLIIDRIYETGASLYP